MEKLALPHGMNMRPARDSDAGFIAALFRSTRQDLLNFLDAPQDFIEELIGLQFSAQAVGYGTAFPEAMYFIVEQHGSPIGRVTLDFGSNEIRVMDISFIPQARRQGHGQAVLQALQQAAGKTRVPLALTVHTGNQAARQLYLKLGFRAEESSFPFERMTWYPGQ